MKIEDIKALIQALDESSLEELSYQKDGATLNLSKVAGSASASVHSPAAPVLSAQASPAQANPAPAPAAGSDQAPAEEASESSSNSQQIKSPMVGVAYLAPAPDKDPYVKVGQTISEGDTVCIVEAMKIMNEIPSPVSGTIKKVLVNDGDVVEFDQPLFEVE